MNRGLLVVALVVGFFMYQHSHASPAQPGHETWLQAQIDALKLKIQKVEALITLMKADKDSEPLTEQHLVPLQNISQAAATQPGMEPAAQPTQSVPVVVAQAPRGHWEYRGIGGRRAVWVPDQHQAHQAQQNQGVFRGGCAGGRCGGIL